MTNQQPTELSQPCIGSLHDPAVFIPPKLAPVFVPPMLVILPIGHDQFDSAAAQSLVQRIGIVATIGNHALRFLPWTAFGARDSDLRPAWLLQA